MVPLVAIVLSALLLIAFLYLTKYEERTGSKILPEARARLDTWVTRTIFVFTHVDFEAFLRESLRALAAHVAHDLAHYVLLTVRATERFLTRLVRHLRSRHAIEAPLAATPRPFVKAMSDFKQQLASSRPTLGELQ